MAKPNRAGRWFRGGANKSSVGVVGRDGQTRQVRIDLYIRSTGGRDYSKNGLLGDPKRNFLTSVGHNSLRTSRVVKGHWATSSNASTIVTTKGVGCLTLQQETC